MRRTHHSFLYLTAGVAFIALLLQGCKGCNGDRETPSARDTAQVSLPTARDSLKNWAELRLIQWKGWVDSSTAGAFGTDSLERTTVDTVAALDTSTMEEDRFREFQPYFVYSPDSSRIVDMVSYGSFLHKGKNGKTVLEAGEPDVEVAIVNVQTKKRERILFAGPSTVIKEAVWVDDHTVLIAGGMYDEQNSLKPVIWKYDTESKLLENWETQ
ncbi:hypothetical protein [Chitinophaga japonensis]|uniref:Uncharacterized protein n=1 Tax=Chitinophaga japonensis TaxID=104662 RepID=A0A562TFG5_CHIJA|nr:hypothetical protein [Chitinophaga japonensis]TWI91720.1 hypothetical protein LX66_1096 [Chitinophaga japonensis]